MKIIIIPFRILQIIKISCIFVRTQFYTTGTCKRGNIAVAFDKQTLAYI